MKKTPGYTKNHRIGVIGLGLFLFSANSFRTYQYLTRPVVSDSPEPSEMETSDAQDSSSATTLPDRKLTELEVDKALDDIAKNNVSKGKYEDEFVPAPKSPQKSKVIKLILKEKE